MKKVKPWVTTSAVVTLYQTQDDRFYRRLSYTVKPCADGMGFIAEEGFGKSRTTARFDEFGQAVAAVVEGTEWF